jgi:putative copper export protein
MISISIELIVRTLLLVSFTVLAGGFAFNLLVLRASALQPLRDALVTCRRNWLAVWLAVTAGTIVLDSLIQYRNEDMAVQHALMFFVRVAVFFVLVFSLRGPWHDSIFAISMCAVLLLTQSLLGHSAREPEWVLPVIADWLHFVFVSIWLGGVAYYAGVVVPQVLQQRSLAPALGASIEKFSPLAIMSVLVIAITGIIQSSSFVGSFDALLNTDYGCALLTKIAVFLALIAFGAFHQFVIAPQINAWRAKAETQEDAARRFRVSITAEALISIATLAAAAAMTLLPLARNAI